MALHEIMSMHAMAAGSTNCTSWWTSSAVIIYTKNDYLEQLPETRTFHF
jgi:hypothetical protein